MGTDDSVKCPTPHELREWAAIAQRCEMEHRHHGYCVDRMILSAHLLTLADTLERQGEALREMIRVTREAGHDPATEPLRDCPRCAAIVQAEEALRER